jgi:catechol 2,3-dioxygenase-like lactoylglutathione lyase family enzyme
LTGCWFQHAIPILRVADLRASIDHYVNVLGFKVDWETPYLVSVSRERCCLFLSMGDQGHPGSWVWIGLEDTDLDALCDELRGRGAKIRNPPTNFWWAYEAQVEDLDGNVLRLGTEPKEGLPHGPWKDMDGNLWVKRADDKWEKCP